MKKIDNLVTELGHQFKEHNLTIVTAESYTGGGLSSYYVGITGTAGEDQDCKGL